MHIGLTYRFHAIASALEFFVGLTEMRYINLRFTFYLL